MLHGGHENFEFVLLRGCLCAYAFGLFFFFQAEDGIRDLVRSRGLGDVYKRQGQHVDDLVGRRRRAVDAGAEIGHEQEFLQALLAVCLLYTSDAADERSSVDLGGRRIIKKKKSETGRKV